MRMMHMRWIFKPIELLIKLVGRLVASIIGLAILIVGIVLCATVVGAVVGIPLAIFGFLLVVRGLF
jgi:hypothetical protein